MELLEVSYDFFMFLGGSEDFRFYEVATSFCLRLLQVSVQRRYVIQILVSLPSRGKGASRGASCRVRLERLGAAIYLTLSKPYSDLSSVGGQIREPSKFQMFQKCNVGARQCPRSCELSASDRGRTFGAVAGNAAQRARVANVFKWQMLSD